MHKKSKCVSHPALIATPPTTREVEPWTWQLRSALVWLKPGMTTWENPLLSLVTRPLGIKRSPRRHSRRTSRSPSRRQLSLTSQVAVTGEPRGTTELNARTLAHGSTTPSKNEKNHLKLNCGRPDFYLNSPVFHLWRLSVAKKRNVLSQLSALLFRYFHLDLLFGSESGTHHFWLHSQMPPA